MARSRQRAAEHSVWLDPDSIPYERLDALAGEAAEAGLSSPHYAIKWLVDRDGVISVVAGAKSVQQLEQLVSCANA